jgi:hypothetical protein
VLLLLPLVLLAPLPLAGDVLLLLLLKGLVRVLTALLLLADAGKRAESFLTILLVAGVTGLVTTVTNPVVGCRTVGLVAC